MSDSNEPSYYEIALTNRQVLVSFVVLLGCVLAAFVAGVWVGRMDRANQVADSAPAPEPEVGAGELAGIEEFQFPSGEGDEQRQNELRKPDLSELRSDPEGRTAVAPPPPRKTAPAESAGRSAPPPPKPPPPKPRASPPPPAPPPRQAAPPAAVATSREELIVQVFASHDESQAKKVIANLRRGGHQAYLSPVEVAGQTRYRVRIGPFTSRAAAEKAAAKITRDYKLETWVTAASN